MAENRKDSGGLYYFSKGRLVIVGLGFTLTCLLVFLLGILIGQGIEERKLLKQEEPLVKVPLAPLAPGSKPGSSAKDELTFYDTLSKAPSAQARTEPASKPEAKPAKETKPEPKEEAKPVAESKAVKTAAADASQKAKAPDSGAPADSKKIAPPKAAEGEKAKAETVAQERVWTVQVNAYPDETRAQKLIERLKAKGYDAYLVKSNINGKDWYRVRVGRFASRGQSKVLLEELQTKENFTKAISVSK